MATEVKTLPANTWTIVLSNVTDSGQVFILDQDIEPTEYLVALVDTGGGAPASDFAGGIRVKESFSPSNSVASDYYMKASEYDGKVAILT